MIFVFAIFDKLRQSMNSKNKLSLWKLKEQEVMFIKLIARTEVLLEYI